MKSLIKITCLALRDNIGILPLFEKVDLLNRITKGFVAVVNLIGYPLLALPYLFIYLFTQL